MNEKLRRFVAPVIAAGLLAAVLVGCGNPPDTGSGGTAPPGEGLYQPPSPIPGSNGDVIWQRPVTINGIDAKAWKVLYHSTNAASSAIGVSGIVIVPNSFYFGDRPLVAMAPETAGLTDDCAPSKYIANGNYIELEQIKQILAKGWAIAITDYEGLGTPGRHTYMVKDSQAHAVLDVARAALRLPGTGLSPWAPIGLWGYSQGGGGAAAAAEAAATYAPELQVKGTAAGGVPADLIAVANALEGNFYGFALAAAQGFDAAYPELNLDSYMNATGRDLVQKIDTNTRSTCLMSLITDFLGKRNTDYSTSNPVAAPAWQARLNQSKLGLTKPSAPIFVYHSLLDEVIPNSVGSALKDRYCATGATVQWNGGYLLEHLTSEAAAMGDVVNYLSDRFAGKAAPRTC